MMMAMQKLFILVVSTLMIASFMPAVFAADGVNAGITPDSPLYGVKRLYEDMRLLVTLDKLENAKLRIELAEKRLLEAAAMAGRNRTGDVSMLLREHEKRVNETEKVIDELQGVGRNVSALVKKLNETSEKNVIVLRLVYEKVPDSAKHAILRALNASASAAVKAEIRDELKERNKTAEEIKELVKEKIKDKLEERVEAHIAAIKKIERTSIVITTKPGSIFTVNATGSNASYVWSLKNYSPGHLEFLSNVTDVSGSKTTYRFTFNATKKGDGEITLVETMPSLGERSKSGEMKVKVRIGVEDEKPAATSEKPLVGANVKR